MCVCVYVNMHMKTYISFYFSRDQYIYIYIYACYNKVYISVQARYNNCINKLEKSMNLSSSTQV